MNRINFPRSALHHKHAMLCVVSLSLIFQCFPSYATDSNSTRFAQLKPQHTSDWQEQELLTQLGGALNSQQSGDLLSRLMDLTDYYRRRGPVESVGKCTDWITDLYIALPLSEQQSTADRVVGFTWATRPNEDAILSRLRWTLVNLFKPDWPGAERLALRLATMRDSWNGTDQKGCNDPTLAERASKCSVEMLSAVHSKDRQALIEYIFYADLEADKKNYSEAENYYKIALALEDEDVCHPWLSIATLVSKLACLYSKNHNDVKEKALVQSHFACFKNLESYSTGPGDQLINTLFADGLNSEALLLVEAVAPSMMWDYQKQRLAQIICVDSGAFPISRTSKWVQTCDSTGDPDVTAQLYDRLLKGGTDSGNEESQQFTQILMDAIGAHIKAHDFTGARTLWQRGSVINQKLKSQVIGNQLNYYGKLLFAV